MRPTPAKIFLPFIAAIALSAPALADHHQSAGHQHHAGTAKPAAGQLAAILAHPRREADRSRDAFRHPAETLDFFRIQPGMTVVDYMPGGGWWTRVLVPLTGPQGRYIALAPDVTIASEGTRNYHGGLAASFPPKAREWTGSDVAAFNTDGLPADLNGTVDRIVIFRGLHNMWRSNMLHRELFAMRRLLKEDGLLGIEQHRARPDASAAYADGSKGYMREKDVVALLEAHGFELVAKSEVNANPADPANHAEGVWTLPPNLRGVAEADKPRIQAIGESDRMTLLFRKRP